MLLIQGCALTSPDFGPKRLVAEDDGAPPDAGSCSGRWLHADPTIADEGLGDLLFVQRKVNLGDMSGDAGMPTAWVPAPPPCTNSASGLPLTANLDSGRNAFGQAGYELAQSGGGTASAFFNENAATGTSAALIRIVGYNGQADDDRIEVDEAQGDCTSTPPSWNGTDLWRPLIDYGTKVGADYTPSIAGFTFVRGWIIDVVLEGPSSPPRPHPTHLRAAIRHDAKRWFLSGEASSRILTSDLLQLNQMGGACSDMPGYAMQKHIECSLANLDSDGDGICDTLSTAWTLQAEDARLGCMRLPPPSLCPTGPQPDDCPRGPIPDAGSPADAAE